MLNRDTRQSSHLSWENLSSYEHSGRQHLSSGIQTSAQVGVTSAGQLCQGGSHSSEQEGKGIKNATSGVSQCFYPLSQLSSPVFFFFFFKSVKTGFLRVALARISSVDQAGLEFTEICLPLPPEC